MDGPRSHTSPSNASHDYDAPASYINIHDVDDDAAHMDPPQPASAAEQKRSQARAGRRRSSVSQSNYDIPDSYARVPELEDIAPISSQDERRTRVSHSFERERDLERQLSIHQEAERQAPFAWGEQPETEKLKAKDDVSRLATEIYTISYLILFAMFGTLARLGLQALTFYVGSPVSFSSVWPNFAGSLVLGFLAEDRMLFRYEWGTPTYELQLLRANQNGPDEEVGASSFDREAIDLAAAKKAHVATKKTIPLYIGLATGFCGSFTSFSSFIRDIFLALSNDLLTPDAGSTTTPRNGGYSFMALLAVTITTVSLSLSGLFIGAQLALALEPITPSLPFTITRKFLDRFAVFLAWGSWIGAVLLSTLPPDRFGSPGAAETWRGRATFALVFAPLGCLGRFYASLYLNGYFASFPLGTFVVNIFGTAVLGMSWDLAHIPLGGVIGCQVLQGVEDGFCGCLTTVSTWVAELAALQRRHAYVYGGVSILVALACMVAIMGGLRWSDGFSSLACMH
ncbi:CrcB-like protein-domain-containing protein [Hypoxylon sp. NC1633]|nr:CrcB-like protein-domain-containing protein [Hypoxylon sp. NC1633]